MGGSLSRTPHYLREAQRLGSPSTPVYHHEEGRPDYGHHSVFILGHSVDCDGRDAFSGESVFGYQMDTRTFDTGHLIVVRYMLNINIADSWSTENKALKKEGPLPVEFFHESILPNILPLRNYMTRVSYSTKDGFPHIKVEHTLSIEQCLRLPTISSPLVPHIPRVSITQLTAPPSFRSTDPFLTVVQYQGRLYTFRHHGVSASWVPQFGSDRLLLELKFLAALTSPAVPEPSYVVTGGTAAAPVFRGYMHPFAPAGSLQMLLARLPPAPMRVITPGHAAVASTTGRMQAQKILHIPWAVKHRWCIAMARAVRDCHAADVSVGCLTPARFVLGVDGQVYMIDVTHGGVVPLYAAPLNEDAAREHEDADAENRTAQAADVFSLGMCFWVLAEEQPNFRRESWGAHAPALSWTKRPDAAPAWFRVMVEMCTRAQGDSRPLVENIHSVLVEQFDAAGYV